MILLLYRSIALYTDFHPSDLEILRTSLAANALAGITGLLLRVDGQFFQVLHGPKVAIENLIEKIARDARHRDIEILVKRPAEEVSPFTNWSMGYDSLLGFQLGLDLDQEGKYPPISPEMSERLVETMIRAARGVSDFGSAFPYARKTDEDDHAYLARLETLA